MPGEIKTGGWPGRPPVCPWIVSDAGGNPCCGYHFLRPHARGLRIARYTLFDQRFIDDALEHLKAHYPPGSYDPCLPKTCPSALARLAYRLGQAAKGQKEIQRAS